MVSDSGTVSSDLARAWSWPSVIGLASPPIHVNSTDTLHGRLRIPLTQRVHMQAGHPPMSWASPTSSYPLAFFLLFCTASQHSTGPGRFTTETILAPRHPHCLPQPPTSSDLL